MEVVVIVDWQEVSVDVGVPKQHVNTGDVMDGLEEAVELLEATRAVPLQSEAAVLCLKLQRRNNTIVKQCSALRDKCHCLHVMLY